MLSAGGQASGLSRPMCVSSGRKKYLNGIPKDVLSLNYKTLCGGLGASASQPCVYKVWKVGSSEGL